jgi:hypothetical protein
MSFCGHGDNCNFHVKNHGCVILRRISREITASHICNTVGVGLQGLSIRPGGMPGILLDAGVSVTSHLWEFEPPDSQEQQCWWQLDEVEQAGIYCGWAESVLLKYRYISNLAALVVCFHAILSAVAQASPWDG